MLPAVQSYGLILISISSWYPTSLTKRTVDKQLLFWRCTRSLRLCGHGLKLLGMASNVVLYPAQIHYVTPYRAAELWTFH